MFYFNRITFILLTFFAPHSSTIAMNKKILPKPLINGSLINHPEKTPPPIIKPKKTKKFRYKIKTIDNHIEIFKELARIKKNTKETICPYCDIKYKNEYTLKGHLLLHLNENDKKKYCYPINNNKFLLNKEGKEKLNLILNPFENTLNNKIAVLNLLNSEKNFNQENKGNTSINNN